MTLSPSISSSGPGSSRRRSPRFALGVEGVAEAVAEEVHGQDGEQDRQPPGSRGGRTGRYRRAPSASESIQPHDVAGSHPEAEERQRRCSATIAAATARVAFTTMGPDAVKADVATTIQGPDAPDARAVSTELLVLEDKTRARTTPGDVHPNERREHPDDRGGRRLRTLPTPTRALGDAGHDEEQVGGAASTPDPWPYREGQSTAPTIVPSSVESNATARPIFSEICPGVRCGAAVPAQLRS